MSWPSMQTKAASVLNTRYALRAARIERMPQAPTLDVLGHPTGVWETFAAWTCAIETTGGDETVVAAKTQAHASHRLTGPYVAGITPAMRVVDILSGRIFAIKAADDLNAAGETLALTCIEKQ